MYIYIYKCMHYIYNVCIYVYGERERFFLIFGSWACGDLQVWQTGDPEEVDVAAWVPSTVWRQNSFFLKGLQSFLFEPSTDWMMPIHVNWLYSKSTDLNINLIWKMPLQPHVDSIWIDIPVAFREFSQGCSKTFVEMQMVNNG